MKKLFISAAVALTMAVLAVPAFATNGTNIIGVGAISRSMGGVGTAAPQDAITAVFGNPAAMCYIPCETSEVDFAGTVFDPTVQATVRTPFTGGLAATSIGAPYAFPAIGIYTPINEKLRFGLAAYGVSGLGVDYKDTDLATLGINTGLSLGTDIKTDLQIMKFAPNIAYMITPDLSVGAAFQANWAALDLGDGGSHNFGFGGQFGVNYKPISGLSLGLTYQTAQNHKFKRIINFNDPSQEAAGFLPPGASDSKRDTLELEQPQHVIIGIAYDVIPDMLLVEVDGKWFNWADAEGYDDFDWEDQYVVAFGTQFKPVDWIAIRAGYNYGNNPVVPHDGWSPFAVKRVQGTNVNRFLYEYLRIVGFPAIAEQHVTAGLGVNVTPKVSLNLGYMHAFGNAIQETSSFFSIPDGPAGNIRVASSLRESSYEFGLNIMF